MVKVSIDVDAARGVSATLRTFFDDAMDEWTGVANAASAALVSTSPLKALQDPLVLISQSATDLDSRVELALLYNTGDSGHVPTGGVLSYELSGSSDSIQDVKQQLGKEIAQNLDKIAPYGDYLDRDDVEAFDYYAALLEKYQDDPDVMTGMFDELGPQGVVQLPVMLKDFADQYERDLGGKSDGDLLWDDDTPMSVHISQMQQNFIEALGTGFGTYTRTSDFDADAYADGIVDTLKNRTGESFGLSQVLRFGEYDPAFLVNVGEGLYEFEKGEAGPVWGSQLNGEVSGWRIGTGDSDTKYYDPFIGLFEAMGRNPQASLDFFNPDNGGSGAQDRSKYFIQERTWRADDFNALGMALDSAATGFHKSGDPNAERAAWMASAAVKFLGDRDGDPAIGDAGKDSLAHLLAAYINDVDRVANGSNGEGKIGVHEAEFVTAPWLEGLPPGANFSADTLNQVLSEVLTDDGSMKQLANAVAHLNAARISGAVDAWSVDTGGEATISGPVQLSGTLMGYLLGNLETGSAAAGKDTDERNQMFVDLASDVVGLVPTGGQFTSFLSGQALSAGEDKISGAFTGNEDAARAIAEETQIRTKLDLQIAVAAALADSPRLPESARTDQHGSVYPWFRPRADIDSLLTDVDTRNLFVEWMRSDAGQVADMLPDLSAAYEDGLRRGR
jgi:hypothetical protein